MSVMDSVYVPFSLGEEISRPHKAFSINERCLISKMFVPIITRLIARLCPKDMHVLKATLTIFFTQNWIEYLF